MRVKLSDAFELQMGKTPARNEASFWNGSNKWVSISDLGNSGKYIKDTKECITDRGVSESGIKIVPANTVIMSFKLSIGKTAITEEELYTNEAIMAFIDKGIYDIDVNYIYHLFGNMDWSEGSNKAVMGITLNKATLSQKKIYLPDIQTQRSIATTLDTLTSLIDKRKHQLSLLDDLVKSRFIELFGDPEHNEKQWDVSKLDALCSVSSSKRIYQNELSMEGVPFLRISDLVNRMDTGSTECELYIPEERYEELKTLGLVPVTGDILITARGTLGRCYTLTENDRFYFQDGMITWLYDFDKSLTTNYLTHLFAMSGFRKQIDSLQAGSTVAYLSISMTKKLNVMLPPLELQNQFAAFVEQVDKSKSAVRKAIDELETLKKKLMQEYFG